MTPAAVRSRLEQRLIDVALAGTAVHWGIRTLLSDRGSTAVGRTIAAIDLVAAALFVLRRAPRAEVSFGPALACLLSAAAGGVSLQLAPEPGHWPLAAVAVFVTAGGFAILSLITLGRSFAVLPSVRAIVSHGPFRLVRHPIYLAEATMVAACVGASPSRLAGLAAAVALGLLVARIVLEERHLLETPAYRVYAEDVRWRLVPKVW